MHVRTLFLELSILEHPSLDLSKKDRTTDRDPSFTKTWPQNTKTKQNALVPGLIDCLIAFPATLLFSLTYYVRFNIAAITS